MFKVVDWGGREFTVYSVRYEYEKTYFLIHNGYDWKWVDGVRYKPVKG